MSDLDRQIAERMGLRACSIEERQWHQANVREGCTNALSSDFLCRWESGPFSPTTDANDREAAIAWLNERDTRVSITYAVAEERAVAVVIWGAIGFGKVTAPTVGEAFGGAFLAASEAIC